MKRLPFILVFLGFLNLLYSQHGEPYLKLPKKYETPSHPWQADRIEAENGIIKKYGLKNKKEIWKAQTSLRRYRGHARELLAKIDSDDPQIKKESNQLLVRLTRFNILPINLI